MADHARLAPSSAHIWAHCSGSVEAQHGRPNPESETTRAGTAAHWAGETTLRAWMDGSDPALDCARLIGKTAPNGVVIDEDMADGAQVFVDDVSELAATHASAGALLLEQRLPGSIIHPSDVWGTCDAALWVPAKAVLVVWDYKHGHRMVDARENLQLLIYLAGLAELLGLSGFDETQITVVVRVVQPFAYRDAGPVDEWVLKMSDARAHWNWLHGRALAASQPGAPCSSGVWCRDCLARVDCETRRRADYNLIDLAEQPQSMADWASDDLARERRILKDGMAALAARFESIEDELRHRITSGDTRSGLILESTAGRLEYTVPVPQVIAIAAQLGVDAAKPGVLTPPQLRKKAPKELRPAVDEVLKGITRRPAGALKLKPAEDSIGSRAFRRKSNATI